MKRSKPAMLFLRYVADPPSMYFEAQIGDEKGILLLKPDEAKSLGSALWTLAGHIEQQQTAQAMTAPAATEDEILARLVNPN